MRPRLAVGCALIVAAAAPSFAQDWFEPNPSLARLSTDDAYTRTSARSLSTAGIGAAVAIRLDDAGRVLVAGNAARIARLDADGRLDPTFGRAGVAEIPVDVIYDVGERPPVGLEVDHAGRIVVTGLFYAVGTNPWDLEHADHVYAAARLLADGSLDPAFAGDGLLELDRATGVSFLGPVHASGIDGAMLALAEKPNPTPDPITGSTGPLVGLVRISADGTIDATYGGGFAPIEYFEQSAFGPISHDVEVMDFAVDSAGRAVVAMYVPDLYYFGVQRLDASGGLDSTFSDFSASQVALDGAGRIVGLDACNVSRRLSDGTRDPTFSGDGVASRYDVARYAGFPDGLQGVTTEINYQRYDPNYDPVVEGSGLFGREFLAVATRADRWVVAHGTDIQSIDPADPGAIVSTKFRSPDGRFAAVAGLAIAPDGTAAYALGDTFVLRVDFAHAKPAPLPNLRVRWIGVPRAVDLGDGRYRVTASVRISNASSRDALAYGYVGFGLGQYDTPLNADGFPAWFRIPGRTSVVRRFTWEAGDATTNLAGARLSVQVACDMPDADFADNVATTAPMTPVAGKGVGGVSSPGGTDAPYGIDPTFGDGGVVRVAMTTLSQPGEFPQAAGVDSEGRIVVLVEEVPSGEYYTSNLLLRLLPDGRLDPGFGDAGRVDPEVDYEGPFDQLAIDPSDRIVLVRGPRYPGYLEIGRLDATGRPDSAFGVDGLVTIPAPRELDFGTTPVTTDAAGDVLVAFAQSSEASPALDTIRVVRLTQSGQVDATFGVNGTAMLPAAYPNWPTAIAVDGAGRIVVGGVVDYFQDDPKFHGIRDARVVLGRFLADGTPDATFDSAAVDPRFGIAPGEAGRISFDPNGRVVVPTWDGLWRFSTDGGSSGPVSAERASRAGLAVGDRGYLAWEPQGSGGVFVHLDPIFRVVKSTVPAPAVVRHMLPLPDGSVVAVGASDQFGDTELLVVKLTPGGLAGGPELRPIFDAPVVHRPRDRFVRGSFTVVNSGIGDAAPSTARLFLSDQPFLDATATKLGSVRVGRIAAGASRKVHFRAPILRGASVAGRFIVVQVDATRVLRQAWRLDDVAASDFIE